MSGPDFVSGLKLPKTGVFGVDIGSNMRSYYKLVYDEESKTYLKIELRDAEKDALMQPLNLLANIPFPKYLRNMLKTGNLSSYLDCLGIVNKKELKEKKQDANTCGMLVFIPESSGDISIIATRYEDISYLKNGVNFMKLGMELQETETDQYASTQSFARQAYSISRGILPYIFDVKEGVHIFDFFVPSNEKFKTEDEYHTFAFDSKKTNEILRAKRKPETETPEEKSSESTYLENLANLLIKCI